MTLPLEAGFVMGATALGKMFGKSRWWAQNLLREWEQSQYDGGPKRVFRKGKQRQLCTTLAVIEQHMPRRRDEALERRLRALEHDRDEAFARIVELERRMGKRR